MRRGGGGGGRARARGLSWIGFTLETWKVGWTLMALAATFTGIRMTKGPTNLGASFLDHPERQAEPNLKLHLVGWCRGPVVVG